VEAKKLKFVTVEIEKGDITAADTDIIVNAANSTLYMGAGVAGAIKLKGGIEIEREAVSKGPIKPGAAVETGAGRLKARHIIHAAVMGEDLKTGRGLVAGSTRSALQLAEALKMESIALPALGTGVGWFPIDKCAEVMFEEIKKFDDSGPLHIKRVKLILFSQKAFNEFEEEYLKI